MVSSRRSGQPVRVSKVELYTELEQPAHKGTRRPEPRTTRRAAVTRGHGKYRPRIERVEDIENPLHLAIPSEPERLDEPDVGLARWVFPLVLRREHVDNHRGGRAGGQTAPK